MLARLPINSYDIAEEALVAMSRMQRDVLERWMVIALDAGELDLAKELAAEARQQDTILERAA